MTHSALVAHLSRHPRREPDGRVDEVGNLIFNKSHIHPFDGLIFRLLLPKLAVIKNPQIVN